MNIEPWFEMSHTDFDAKRKLLGLFPDYALEYINPMVITLSRLSDWGYYNISISILHPNLTLNDLMPENLDTGEYYNISNSKLMDFELDISNLIVIHFEMNTIFKLLNLCKVN